MTTAMTVAAPTPTVIHRSRFCAVLIFCISQCSLAFSTSGCRSVYFTQSHHRWAASALNASTARKQRKTGPPSWHCVSADRRAAKAGFDQ